jgi:hypothetical protein
MAGVSELKEARVSTILAPLDQVDRLAEAGSVYVRKRKHLRVIEKRAESVNYNAN